VEAAVFEHGATRIGHGWVDGGDDIRWWWYKMMMMMMTKRRMKHRNKVLNYRKDKSVRDDFIRFCICFQVSLCAI
jgi:hypothetical protein